MLYFRGCTARERLNSISESSEKILNILHINFETLDNEECCGSVLLRTGFKKDGIEHMEKNVKKLKDEKIVVSCAGCYKTLKEDYKNYLGVELDVIHISQLLNDLINNYNIDFESSNDLGLSVTYHDPCHLGRHSGEFEAPREIIKKFSKLVEMENIRENSKCCGSGGGVKSAFPEIAKSIAIERSKEAENTDCDLIVTSCPFCKLNLDENSSLEVLDLSEFVLKYIEKYIEDNCVGNNSNEDNNSEVSNSEEIEGMFK